ncbi:MAG: hypothetical protein HS099_00500 [Ardenticatenaceae bacterium]|nr:hypothetical protein [Ardenticatenaceae bacterium]
MENPTSNPTVRITFPIGGQVVATRVTNDPVSGNNGLFYMYSDHPSTGSGQVWAAPACWSTAATTR